MRFTSSRSSTSRTIWPSCRSIVSRALARAARCSPSASTPRACCESGASGLRSSCASVARNSSLRRRRRTGRPRACAGCPRARLRSVMSWLTVPTPTVCLPRPRSEHLVRHPARLARLEVPEPHLDLAVALLEHRRKELVRDPRLVLREEELAHTACAAPPRGCRARSARARAIDEDRHGLRGRRCR